ncbi:MAG: hypothetical protein M3Y27_08980 [Acidobacteriota bacterium]|nr:hypothetical protein [Acidobacteriota bacterium]
MLAAAVLFFIVSIKPDHTALRAGCPADDVVIASIPAGTPVELRFSVSDGSDCFKIAATVDGKRVEGYVSGTALSGLDQFERERRSAPDTAAIQVIQPFEIIRKAASLGNADPFLVRANKLLEANQPGKALDLLEPALKQGAKDPDLLFVAGLAAYRSDQAKNALDYWKQSLDLKPNEALARLYYKVQREASSDRSGEKLYGMRVLLRYEGETVSPEVARGMVALLDEEFTRISGILGCPAEERVIAIVQSRQAYLRSTDAAEWSGGQYDGRIRVSFPGADRRVLAHEIVHACLTNISAAWPAWVHEGFAQKLSGDVLSPVARDQIRKMASAHGIPRLENMGQTWSRMSAQHAHTAYRVALAAADLLFAQYGDLGVRNVLTNPERLPSITADLDRQLGL